ncbi:hypothetical protein OS493_021866 [Desmophyllum pertusum]|uniref:Uncharacterized protein n=1 Tax=Desmophyllum pertusum TaxID=174260 RepID=A0A9W9ZMQ5_9CNID|nr:hypothetical protein OS493_021866 [Desmophyllum pertusum]
MHSPVIKFTAAYFLVQSCLFYEVCSSPVKISQSTNRKTIDEDVAELMDDSKLEEDLSFNTSSTIPQQEHGSADVDNCVHTVLSRLKRHSRRPCEIRRIRKWNHCLEKHFTEVRCRKHSVVCLSPNNIPPKCKKNFEFIFGKNGGCRVLTSCTCAA